MTPPGPQVYAAPRRRGAAQGDRGVPGHPARRNRRNRPARQPAGTRGRYRELISEEELPRDSEVCALVTIEAPAAGDSLE